MGQDMVWYTLYEAKIVNLTAGTHPVHLHLIQLQNFNQGVEIMSSFFKQVYGIVEQIPYGKVVSYGQIASMLGRPRAAREVGRAMRCCPDGLPWQRVVMKDGAIAGGTYAKVRKSILETEGVVFLSDGRVDMDLCNWLGRARRSSNVGDKWA